MNTTKTKAYAAQDATSALTPFDITRREPGPLDVEIEILYCGVCHSDVHTSPNKIADGLRLGAHEVVVSKDADAMKKHQGSFNFILDAVSAQHDINAYLSLLKLDGTLTLVGAPEQPLPVSAFNLLLPRRNFAGSAIGGIAETQEMLDFCATHRIVSDIELIPIQKINEAWDRLLKQDVRYRFVIDMASLKS